MSVQYGSWVEISFDCLPLRTIGRFDIPLDASPKFRKHCERVKECLEKHGSLNSYYLYNASCHFFLTNDRDRGMMEFVFDGVVLTNDSDDTTTSVDLDVRLVRETCDWLTEPVVQWFHQSVLQAVRVEFDRYIFAGDLARTRERLAKLRSEADEKGGFLGMYL